MPLPIFPTRLDPEYKYYWVTAPTSPFLTVTMPAGTGGIRSRGSQRTGKWYFEVTASATGGGDPIVLVGVIDHSIPVTGLYGAPSLFWGMSLHDGAKRGPGVAASWVSGLDNGDWVGCYVDFDAGTIGFKTAGGDHGLAFTSLDVGERYHVYIGTGDGSFSEQATVNFGSSAFQFSVPSGYVAGFGGNEDQLNSSLSSSSVAEAALTTGAALKSKPSTAIGSTFTSTSWAVATLQSNYFSSGWMYSESSLTGDLEATAGVGNLNASMQAEATLEADLASETTQKELAARIVSWLALTPTLSSVAVGGLQATVQSIATLTATLDTGSSASLAASMAADASVTATMEVAKPLAVTASASASLSGTIPSEIQLGASAVASASITAAVYLPVQMATSAEAEASLSASLAYRLRYFFGVSSGATVAGVCGFTYTQTISGVLGITYSTAGRLKYSLGVSSNIGRVDTRVQSVFGVSFNTVPVTAPLAISSAGRVTYSFAAAHAVGYRVRGSMEISYACKATSVLGVSYSERLQMSLAASSAMVTRQKLSQEFSYFMSRVLGPLKIASALQARRTLSFGVSSTLYEVVRAGLGVSSAIRNTNRLTMSLGVGYSISSQGSLTANDAPVMYINGASIVLEEASVACDEGGQVWEGTFTLMHPEDALGIAINDEFMVVLGGDPYSFIVDSRAVSRAAPAEVSVTIYGRSPLVEYASPRAETMSKTWEVDTAASAIAEELIPGVAWNIVDWIIPAGVFGVERATPYEALAKLAEAAGGLVESWPNGLVVVRYRHPTPVVEYGPATASFAVSDMEDTFEYSERYQPVDTVDLLTISNVSLAEAKDRAEFSISEDPEVGTLYVYPNAWRDTAHAHATGDIRSIEYLGVESRQETETVEFVAGKSSVRFPVVSVDAVIWKTTNLGLVTAGEYTSGLSCSVGSDGYSMASITYTTKAHTFRVVGDLGTEVQLVIEE